MFDLQRSLIFWREFICLQMFYDFWCSAKELGILEGKNLFYESFTSLRKWNCFETNCMDPTQASLNPMCTISTVSYGNGWVNSSWPTRATISPIHVYARNTFFVLFVYLERTFKWQSCQRFSLIKHVKFSVWLNLGTCMPLWMTSVGFCKLIVQDIWRT